jgi:tetratricopeptide (TPR) repeat protein
MRHNDAHLAWAYALKSEWRWAESERQFRQALALAPDDATIHHWYGVLLYVIGRVDEGVAQLKQARTFDPAVAKGGKSLVGVGQRVGYRLRLDWNPRREGQQFIAVLVCQVGDRPDDSFLPQVA